MLIHRTWGHRANCMCFMSLTGNPRSPDRALGGIIHSHISYANADAPHALMIIESFVDQYMNPFPNFNSVLVLDNASCYQNKNISRAVEAAGARLLYIPPGAKELNPIEEAFSKVKSHVLRNRSDVERDPLDTLLKAFHSITPQDAEGYFRHAGWTISRSDDVELLLALEEQEGNKANLDDFFLTKNDTTSSCGKGRPNRAVLNFSYILVGIRSN